MKKQPKKKAEVTWHGWSRFGTNLYIGRIPGRRSPCLYTVEGSVLTVFSYFQNEKRATHAMQKIDALTGIGVNQQ